MYNVWNTIHADDVAAVLEHANNNRYAVNSEKVKQDTVIITDEWMAELDAMPFVSKQKGRMSMLLKQKSKVQAVPKKRATYDAFDFVAKMRDSQIPA